VTFLRRLFSSGTRARETLRAEASVEYNGYMIAPGPEKAPGGWRVAGTIAKEIRGDRKVQHFDRADASPDREAIVAMTIEKARRIIDEQGDRLFHDA
jgi:hypothetical protein